MYGRKSKIASSRRLKAPFAHGGDAYAQQQAAANAAHQAAAGPERNPLQTRPSTAAAPQLHHTKSSKAQALAAFHGLVESASRARLGLPLPGGPVATAEAVAVAAHHPEPLESPQGERQKLQDADKAVRHATAPAAAAAAAVGRPLPAAGPEQQQPHQPQSAVPIAAAQPSKPVQPSLLIPRAASALKKLQQQLSSRTLTYLYQFDALLQQAKDTLTAVGSYLTAGGTTVGSAELLQHLLQQGYSQTQGVQVADAILSLCSGSWEVIILLLQHHRMAEPANTATQAREIHEAARMLWDTYESAAQAGLAVTSTAGESVGEEDCHEGRTGRDVLINKTVVETLATLAKVAGHWSDSGDLDTADWCFLQLRKHLCSISKAAADSRTAVAGRKQLQQLQMNILQGNIAMVARQGQQVLWVNLTNMLQQLLTTSVMDSEDTISHCLTLAGTLAEQAKQLSKPASGSSLSSSSGGNEALRNACRMLEYAAELLEYCRAQVDTLQQQQQQQQQQQGPGAGAAGQAGSDEQHMVLRHISCIQQQVLLQLGQAYLLSKQYTKALDCVNRLRDVSTGLAPPPGLIQLSTLALIGQEKHMPACAQLCAWLKQSAAPASSSSSSSSSAQEACAAVIAFLQALHGSACDAGIVGEIVELVAAAAVERGCGDAAVAVAVVKELLSIEVDGNAHHSSLEQLVVKLLAREEVAQLIMKNAEAVKFCHDMLHQRAQLHYEAHSYTAAVELLTPAVFFSTTVTVGRSARLLAMCLLKSQQPQRAVDYITLAEQQEGQMTSLGCLIRVQALLLLAAPAAATGCTGIPTAAAAAAAAGGNDDATRADDEEVVAAVHMLSSCVDFDGRSAQAAFSLCMQAGQVQAAWEVLKTWDKERRPAKAAAAALDSSHGSLQTLVLMANLYQQERHQPLSSSSCGDAATAMVSGPLADLCSLYGRCTAQLKLVENVPAAPRADASAAAAPAGRDVYFSNQQLMWLVDVGMQFGVEAAEHGLLDLAVRFMQCTSACCTALQEQQQQQQQMVAQCSQQPSASDSAVQRSSDSRNGDRSSENGSVPATAAAEACRRHLSALAAATMLLLHGTAGTAANQQQQQQFKHSRQLLDLGQQQLLLLQHLEGADGATDPAAGGPTCSSSSSSLQYLFSKIGFILACRERNEQRMKHSLQQMVQNPHAQPSDLEAAAHECVSPTAVFRSETVAALAYGYMFVATAALDTAAAAGAGNAAAAAAAVDLAAVSAAVVGILGLVTSHGVRIKVCDKVAAVLAATLHQQQQQHPGSNSSSARSSFPAETLQWLIVTCWNAAVQLSSSHATVAMRYLNCAAALSSAQQPSQKGPSDNTATVAGSAASSSQAKQQQQQQQHWLLSSRQYRALRVHLAAQLVDSDPATAEPAVPATADTTAVDVQDHQPPPCGSVPVTAQDTCKSSSPAADRSDAHDGALDTPAATAAAAADIQTSSPEQLSGSPGSQENCLSTQQEQQQQQTAQPHHQQGLEEGQFGQQCLQPVESVHTPSQQLAAAVNQVQQQVEQPESQHQADAMDRERGNEQLLHTVEADHLQSQQLVAAASQVPLQVDQTKPQRQGGEAMQVQHGNVQSLRSMKAASSQSQQPAAAGDQVQQQMEQQEPQHHDGVMAGKQCSQQCLQPGAAHHSMLQQPAAAAGSQQQQPALEHPTTAAYMLSQPQKRGTDEPQNTQQVTCFDTPHRQLMEERSKEDQRPPQQSQQQHCALSSQQQHGEQQQCHLEPAGFTPQQQQQQQSLLRHGHSQPAKATSRGPIQQAGHGDMATMRSPGHPGGGCRPISQQASPTAAIASMQPALQAAAAGAGSLHGAGGCGPQSQQARPTTAVASTQSASQAAGAAAAVGGILHSGGHYRPDSQQASPAAAAPTSMQPPSQTAAAVAGSLHDPRACGPEPQHTKPTTASAAAAASMQLASQAAHPSNQEAKAAVTVFGKAHGSDVRTRTALPPPAAAALADTAASSGRSALGSQATDSLQPPPAAAAAARQKLYSLTNEGYTDHGFVMATPDDDISDAGLGPQQDHLAVNGAAAAAVAWGDHGPGQAATVVTTLSTAAAGASQQQMAMAVDDVAKAAAAASGGIAYATVGAVADVHLLQEAMVGDDAEYAGAVAAATYVDPARAAACCAAGVGQLQEAMALDDDVEAVAVSAASGGPATAAGEVGQLQEAMEVDAAAAAESAGHSNAAADYGQQQATAAMDDDVESAAAAAAAPGGPEVAAAAADVDLLKEAMFLDDAGVAPAIVAASHGPGLGQLPLAATSTASLAAIQTTGEVVDQNNQSQISSLQLRMESQCDSPGRVLGLCAGPTGTAAAAAVAHDGMRERDEPRTAARAAVAVPLAGATGGGVDCAHSGLIGGSSAAAAAEAEEVYDDFTQGLQLVLSDGDDDQWTCHLQE